MKIYYGIKIDGVIDDLGALLRLILPNEYYVRINYMVANNITIIYIMRISNEKVGTFKFKETLTPYAAKNMPIKPNALENIIIKSIADEIYKYMLITSIGYHCVK